MAKYITNALSCFFILFFISLPAMPATYINRTRIIINEKSKEASFTIYNEGVKPVLLQLWTEENNIFERPEKIKTPLLILPPMFRLEKKTSRAVRVKFVGYKYSLPADRESLFWLNLLEIPPIANDNLGKHSFQVAFRTRIKLFWRPSGLAKNSIKESIKNLYTYVSNCKGKRYLLIENNSPLHVTLDSITLNDGTKIKELPDNGLWIPLSAKKILLPRDKKTDSTVKAFSWIDDHGVVNLYTVE